MKEQTLSISDFNEPLSLENTKAIATLIIRLILLEPGTIQSHPEMGVGLISKWRYSDTENLEELEEEINNQISTYLPILSLNSVSISSSNKILVIQNICEGETYVLSTDESNNTLKLIDILQ